jgi:hypothetical protein
LRWLALGSSFQCLSMQRHQRSGTSSHVRRVVASEAETLSSSLVCFVLGACLASPPVPPAIRDLVVLLSLTAGSSHDISGTPFTDLLAIRVARVDPWLSCGVVVVISWFAHLCSYPSEQNHGRLPLRSRDA